VLITSEARVHPLEPAPGDAVDTDLAGLAVRVSASEHAKCAAVGTTATMSAPTRGHPWELCGRCVENV
jgi:isoleucyl-tRNA synthetase